MATCAKTPSHTELSLSHRQLVRPCGSTPRAWNLRCTAATNAEHFAAGGRVPQDLVRLVEHALPLEVVELSSNRRDDRAPAAASVFERGLPNEASRLLSVCQMDRSFAQESRVCEHENTRLRT